MMGNTIIPSFVDWSYYSQVIDPIETLNFLIKCAFILKIYAE